MPKAKTASPVKLVAKLLALADECRIGNLRYFGIVLVGSSVFASLTKNKKTGKASQRVAKAIADKRVQYSSVLDPDQLRLHLLEEYFPAPVCRASAKPDTALEMEEAQPVSVEASEVPKHWFRVVHVQGVENEYETFHVFVTQPAVVPSSKVSIGIKSGNRRLGFRIHGATSTAARELAASLLAAADVRDGLVSAGADCEVSRA